MSTLALCSPPSPSVPRRSFLATVAAAPLVGPLAAFPQPGCLGASAPQPFSSPAGPPSSVPKVSPGWASWDEVACILAGFEWDSVGDWHSSFRIEFRPGVSIIGGTGSWPEVSADLADARDLAGDRLLGQGIVRRGSAWAVVVWDETETVKAAGQVTVEDLLGDTGGAS